MASVLGNVGNIYLNKGELEKALGYLMNIGDVFAQKGDKERALEWYLEAQDFVVGYNHSLFESINTMINSLLKKK